MDPSKHHQVGKVKYPNSPDLKLMPQGISMVISNYNHSEMIRRLLWQLSHTQIFTPVMDFDFEVIVTDSGSNKENHELMEVLLLLYGRRLEMKYVQIDCSKEREADPKFNGYSRCVNAGFKVSQYDTVVYADSSVLVPEDYLWDLTYPLTQRDKRFVRSPLLNTNEEQAKKIVQSSNWRDVLSFGPFKHSTGRPSWAIKKEHFIALGGMDESMCRYGAVDDDFVLRAIMYGCDNIQSKSAVIHLFHREPNRGCDDRNGKIFREHAKNDIKQVNVGREWGKYTCIKEIK